MLVVSWIMTRVRIWENRSVVCGVVETGVWTAYNQQAAGGASREKKNDWIVQVIPQQAIKALPVLSTRKIVTRRQELGWHFLLRR
jgi:hypothetical protein